MSVNLLIMAAGLGSRFGGDKQLVDVGPNGESFFDYAIRDSLNAGATDVVIVVRSSIEQQVLDHVSNIHPGLDITTVCQDKQGPERPKPWGTAHAVLSAADAITGPFVVVNADDYYGPSSYEQVVSYLGSSSDTQGALVGFELSRTLPKVGAVSRGVCHSQVNDSGDGAILSAITETHGLLRNDEGVIVSDDPVGTYGDETLVSMNMWGLPKSFFGHLETKFEAFLSEFGHEEKSEFLLPTSVSELMASGDLSIEVLSSSENWIGVTNPDDLEVARSTLRERG